MFEVYLKHIFSKLLFPKSIFSKFIVPKQGWSRRWAWKKGIKKSSSERQGLQRWINFSLSNFMNHYEHTKWNWKTGTTYFVHRTQANRTILSSLWTASAAHATIQLLCNIRWSRSCKFATLRVNAKAAAAAAEKKIRKIQISVECVVESEKKNTNNNLSQGVSNPWY